MTPEETQRKAVRVEAISQQIEGIPAILDGTLLTKHNRVRRVDGSIRTSPEHYTFQYRGTDGKRMWKRIPLFAEELIVGCRG
jgi:hypothetical protein